MISALTINDCSLDKSNLLNKIQNILIDEISDYLRENLNTFKKKTEL